MLSLFKKKATAETLQAYISGSLCPIKEVPDEIFSQEMMGEGVAIIAKDSLLCAPCDGEITLIAPSKHAIAIRTKDDIQVLLHIGLDSTLHKGDVFTVHVKCGDMVHQGDRLIEIADSYLKASDPLYIPLVVVENPNKKSFSFRSKKEAVMCNKDIIASYE